MALYRLVPCDVQMLGLQRGERDAVISCIQAAIVQLAIVLVDRAKARIELNGLIASVVIRRVNGGRERGLDEMESSIKQDGDCPLNVWTRLERYREPLIAFSAGEVTLSRGHVKREGIVAMRRERSLAAPIPWPRRRIRAD